VVGMWTRFMEKEGRNSLVFQDIIGSCHIQTNIHKKTSEHRNLCEYTRNEAISTDNISFRGLVTRFRCLTPGFQVKKLCCICVIYNTKVSEFAIGQSVVNLLKLGVDTLDWEDNSIL
jgi:hypothetical protein